MIVDTTRSPFATLRPVPVEAVELRDDFWKPRRDILLRVTLPEQYRILEETGRIDNFRWAAGKHKGGHLGFFYNDSDVYKWLEAASWALAGEKDPALAQLVESVINEIAAAQGPDGYLNTYFSFERAAQRWTNLRDMHELYCAGHLIQAAIAYRRATGDEHLLEVACRLADYICEVFGPEEGKRPGVPGHPEVEMALVELARTTEEKKYLHLAQFFLDQRGYGLIGGRAYHLDHLPFRRLERMVGHAVRAGYLSCGAADICLESGEAELLKVLKRLWDAMTDRQMYITGGVGSLSLGEAFGGDYELPNATAYAETCAAIASLMWNWRMLQVEGEARFADLMELALYNGILAGVSLDGRAYFYENPLASDGHHHRQPWFDCACCPTNIIRVLAALPGYFYSISEEGIWIHLYGANHARLHLLNGTTIKVRQSTRYPWDGEVNFEIEGFGDRGEGEFSVFLRVPGWVGEKGIGDKGVGASLELNGKLIEEGLVPGYYFEIRRTWRVGDEIRLHLPMPVRYIEAHPYVEEDYGRIAVKRGPLVYCAEGADNPSVDLRDVFLKVGSSPREEYVSGLLNGVVRLSLPAEIHPLDPRWKGRLYREVDAQRPSRHSRNITKYPLTTIPYYAWANREPGLMRVWFKTTRLSD